ncbi:hypothetical protein [Sharpea azabuensis]|uniref:hypothetical protein n=1 Tax=Sharpea azabuensis TaxID=322505 RepID=UPI002E80A901|nr:hypothetical protein [Sharpea azabuensis]MEE3308523.1 hypothetical protein [Sharpea azabuensis]
MAKYKLKNSNNTVNCEILNESAGDYIVRFNNGVIQNVPKDRVSQLDKIDEGVLDTVRQAAGAVNKYGRKFASKVKDIAQKVAQFVVNAFIADGFVFFKNGDGKLLAASHPVNAMEGAKDTDCVNFVPGSGTVELCNELGIEPEAVENYEFEGEYEGAMPFDTNVNESSKGSSSLLKTLFEAEDSHLAKNEKISLRGTFCNWSQEQIVNYLGNEYMSRYEGRKPNGLPLFIWGAPGIGKTSIIRSLRDVVKQETGKEINIISINGGNVGPDDFTMPATIVRTLKSNDIEDADNDDFKGATQTTIKDLPKNWLPVYNPQSEEADPELLNAIANGGGLVTDENGNEVIENGPGGIFFIDEYSRMTQAGMDALMQAPTTREIGSNSTLRFGDRWVIVCAANRKSDMSRRGGAEALAFEGASKTRFNHCNFVPDPKDWLEWAKKESSRRPGRKNVLTDIVTYIESELKRDPKDFGDFYEMWSHPTGELNGEKGTANPRTWEALSETLIDQCLENRFGKKYPSISSMPKSVLADMASGIVGGDVAKRFATFVAQFSLFKPEDAENVWTKGDNAKYEIIKQQKLNSANIEEYFDNHIFPLLKECYPGGLDNGVAPDAALHFMQFLEACCYDGGKFNLNRFKTISTKFGFEFNVDLKSLTGPYADAANYKEDVIAKNELV